jgi:pimeloyl-ACP methyl ester carboxylesterase
MVRHLCALIGAALVAATAFGQQPLEGHWEGELTVLGSSLAFRVDLSSGGDSLLGTIDIPQQNAYKRPLQAVRYTPPHLSFELPAGPGLAIFEGSIAGDSVHGEFRQASFRGTFQMHRVAMNVEAPPAEQPALPYREEEVKFTSEGITLGGTLTLPEGKGPFPAIVLLTGSGAQDRNETLFGFAPFRILADTLTRSGLSVLRFDDRGVGASGGSFSAATTNDFVADAIAAVDFLQTRSEVDPDRIALLGHSEGALVAARAAVKGGRISCVVFLAGPGVRADSLILAQMEGLAKASAIPPEVLAENLDLERQVFDVVRRDSGWDALRSALTLAALRKLRESGAAIPSVDSLARGLVDAQLMAVRSPWFRQFIKLDPATDLRQLHCPVLALFGGKDMQVPVEINRPPMEHALREAGNTHVTVEVFPDANHLFQEARTGNPKEYPELKKAFAPGVVKTIVRWLTAELHPGRLGKP